MTKECCQRACLARYVFAVSASLCLGILYTMKIVLSVAILFMVDSVYVHKNIPDPEECDWPILRRLPDGPIKETFLLQGVALSSYYMGYCVMQIPASYLAERVSGKWTMAAAVLGNILCTLLTPVCVIYLPIVWFCVLRVFQGIFASGAVPATNVMIGRWCPPQERSPMYCVAFSGPGYGIIFGTAWPGMLMYFLVPWDWIFYSIGILAVIIFIIWAAFVGETPKTAFFISADERDYITEATEDVPEAQVPPYKFPWAGSCGSCKFWTIAVAHWLSNFGWFFMCVSGPTFFRWVLHGEPVQVTMMFACAYMLCFVFSFDISVIGVLVLPKHTISVTAFRKIANSICSLIPAVMFIVIPFTGCYYTLSCVLFIIAIVSVGAMSAGIIANCIDLSPNFKGWVITNSDTIALTSGIAVPIVIGWEMEFHGDIEDYWFTFLLIGILYVIMFIEYTIAGSGKTQPWNEPKERVKVHKEKEDA